MQRAVQSADRCRRVRAPVALALSAKRNSSDHRWGLLVAHFYSQTTIAVSFTM